MQELRDAGALSSARAPRARPVRSCSGAGELSSHRHRRRRQTLGTKFLKLKMKRFWIVTMRRWSLRNPRPASWVLAKAKERPGTASESEVQNALETPGVER